MQNATTKLPLKKLSKFITITTVTTGIFLLYLMLIGVPKTQARNLYNDAQLELGSGQISAARNLLEQAYKTWPEAYIQEALENLN